MFGSTVFAGVTFAGVAPMLATPHAEFRASYTLQVDWNNDGDFSDANEDLSSRWQSAEYIVGRDYASQLVGRSSAGQLRARLFNADGLYSSFNAASPLYGLLLPNRKVRLRSIDAEINLWTGFLEGPPKPTSVQGKVPLAELGAVGPLALLANPNLKISPAPMHNVRTGAVVNAILDAAGWPAANRSIDVGDVILGNWYVENKGALEALQEIEEAEGGFLREGTNWDIIFEGRYHRSYDLDSSVSQASFSDAAAALLSYKAINQDDPLRQIFNRVEIPISTYHIAAVNEVVFTSTEAITLQPGESRTIFCNYGNDIAYLRVTPTISPTVTPFSLSGSLTSSVTSFAHSAKVTLTNIHGSQAMSVVFTLSGQPVREVAKYTVQREDVTSQSKYNLRTYPFSSPWFLNIAHAEASAQWVISTYKDPHPVLRVDFPIKPDSLWLQSVMRDVSDRITLEADNATVLGINQDFYIEATGLTLPNKAVPKYFMLLSPTEADPGWGLFDVHRFDTSMRFAY